MNQERCIKNRTMLLFPRVISPIDGKSMESVSSMKMFQKSEYKENGKIIRWTEVGQWIYGEQNRNGACRVFCLCVDRVSVYLCIFTLVSLGILSPKRRRSKERSE